MPKLTIEINIPTRQELFESLHKEDQTDAIEKELYDFYQREVSNFMSYSMRAKKPTIIMNLFSGPHTGQQVAEFAIRDLELPQQETYNWHLQNTSQLVYNGCILVQDGQVSTHH